jgi:hypothetical protein
MTPKPRRVTAEHTRDRVRNNQRRHHAQRKNYIATLQEKLHEAEKTISALRSQIHDLKEALGRINSKRISTTLASEPKGLYIQEAPAVVDRHDLLFPSTGFVTEDHDPGAVNETGRDDLPGMNVESIDLALSILEPTMFPSLFRTGYSLAYQSYQNNSYLEQDQSATTTNTCCSPLNPTPSNLPISPIRTELSAELMRLCCEAYTLIAQQNASILREETCTNRNPVPSPQLISCNFRMSCCSVKAEVSGPQVWTSISYLQCNI